MLWKVILWLSSLFLWAGSPLYSWCYSPATLKMNKKYLNFFWVFPQITRVMRSLSIKNNCRNASKNEKITIFKILGIFWGIFQKFWFLENFELWYGSIFLNETFSIDLSLILKNNQPELDGHGHDFMPNMPIFQKIFFSKMSPKSREF